MMPHVLMGIRERTHCPPIGPSRKRPSAVKNKIRALYLAGHNGILSAAVVRQRVRETEKELMRKKGRHGNGAARWKGRQREQSIGERAS